MIVHEYYFDPDHQVPPDQLLAATKGTQTSIDGTDFDKRIETYQELESYVRGLAPDNPVPYAVIGDSESSKEYAAIVQLPFANRVTPIGNSRKVGDYLKYGKDPRLAYDINGNSWNALTKHYLAYLTLRQAGITDPDGKPIPFIVVSAPSGDHTRKWTKEEKQAIRSGNFQPMVNTLFDIAEHEGFKRIIPIGYSQGACVTEIMPYPEDKKRKQQIIGTVVAERPMTDGIVRTISNYTRPRLLGPDGKPVAKNNVQPKTDSWLDNSPKLITDLSGTDKTWTGNILAAFGNNLIILQGLSKRSVAKQNLTRLARDGNTVFVYGKRNCMSHGMETIVSEHSSPHIVVDCSDALNDQNGFGENHQYYADFVTRAITHLLSR